MDANLVRTDQLAQVYNQILMHIRLNRDNLRQGRLRAIRSNSEDLELFSPRGGSPVVKVSDLTAVHDEHR